MKNILLGLFVLIIFCFSKCKKNTLTETLPPATQEGKNTMGFKVNGKVWVPYFPCGFGQNPCGAVQLNYHLNSVPAYYLNFHPARKINGNLSSLIITSIPNTTISTTGNKFDSVNISFNDYANGITTYNKSYNPKGSFIITKVDFFNQIISGTLDCTLYNGIDSVVITEGRFDCKFYTCVCN